MLVSPLPSGGLGTAVLLVLLFLACSCFLFSADHKFSEALHSLSGYFCWKPGWSDHSQHFASSEMAVPALLTVCQCLTWFRSWVATGWKMCLSAKPSHHRECTKISLVPPCSLVVFIALIPTPPLHLQRGSIVDMWLNMEKNAALLWSLATSSHWILSIEILWKPLAKGSF